MKELEQGSFAGCSNLQSLTLPFPGSGTATNTGSFASLFGTTSVEGMKKVGSYYLPANLKEVTIGEGCEQIPADAFYNCTMIEKLTLPTTIKGVKENALYGCDGLTDIYVKRALPPSAYESTFTGVNQFGCTLHVPHDSQKYYSVATGWKYFYFIEEEAPIAINVTNNIENAGEILGLRQYQPGESAALEAIAHSGYRFSAWTDGGTVVSTEAQYAFTVTDSRDLIAVFVPVNNENDIKVTPGAGKVNFTWQAEEGAEAYTLSVYADEAMTQLVNTAEFDANGTPVARTTTSLSAEITGLDVAEAYYYSLTAYTASRITLSQYTGNFAITADGITDVTTESTLCRPVSGGIEVRLAGGSPVSVFNLKGQAVHHSKADSGHTFIALPSGIYIVKVGERSMKCVVR